MSDRRYYAAFGDRISMEPTGRGVAALIQERLAETVSNLRLLPLTMPDATVQTVRYVQAPRLAEMNAAPSFATVTLGWHDVLPPLSRDIKTTCAIMRRDGDVALSRVRNLCLPDASFVIASLYDPYDGADPALADKVTEFNAVFGEIAERYDARIADIHGAFRGHGVGPNSDPATAWLDTNDTLAPTPNAAGARAIADAIYAIMSQHIASRELVTTARMTISPVLEE